MYGWSLTEKLSQDNKLEVLEAQKAEILNQISQQQVQYNAIKELQKEKLKLDSLIDHFSQIIMKRTDTVKALDALHDLVPEGAWLTKIEFNKNQVTLIGESEPLELDAFIDNLNEEDSYYKNAKISQVNSSKDNYKTFEISSELVIHDLVLTENQEESL